MDFIISKITTHAKQNKLLTVVYACNIFLSFHYYLLIYINSSFLAQFFTKPQISLLYIIGSALNLTLLLNTSKLLNRFGNYKMVLVAIFVECGAIIGLSLTESSLFSALFFLAHHVVVPIILFNLDVFLESESQDESKTGGIRGMYLTLANITLVIAPTLVGLILLTHHYQDVYILSLVFLIPLLMLIYRYFRKFTDIPVAHIKIRETIAVYLRTPNLYRVFIAHLTLQLFYAFMIIYTPLYLSEYIGFTWSEMGIMFTIMLIPFALFELPIGRLADTTYGERGILTIGLIIMGLSTITMSFITVKSFILWTALLFLTRTGASFVEITSDSFFFKQVDKTTTDEISIYRTTRPIAFIVAPIIATLALTEISYQYLFIIVGICCIATTRWSIALPHGK